MPYQVPDSKRSIDQNKFEFSVPGDPAIYKVPKVKYLPLGQIEVLEGSAENVSLRDILDLFGEDEAAQAAVRTLDTEQLQALTEAWQKDSGIEVGESSGSTNSSVSTESPSNSNS